MPIITGVNRSTLAVRSQAYVNGTSSFSLSFMLSVHKTACIPPVKPISIERIPYVPLEKVVAPSVPSK